MSAPVQTTTTPPPGGTPPPDQSSLSFTPTQQRLLRVLSDGQDHSAEELRAVLGDDMAGRSALSVHLTYLRKKLQRQGQDVVCLFRHGFFYRHVRLLADPYDPQS